MVEVIKDEEGYAVKITNLKGKDLIIYADGNVLGLDNFFDKSDATVVINHIPMLLAKAKEKVK